MRLSVVALAGAALLAVSTIASADDNGALTGAAGGRCNWSRRRWASWSRRGWYGWCGRGWRCNGCPSARCGGTRTTLCDKNDNHDQ
jgi:hypothetical protein